jgi:hypothetical protein
MVQTVEKYNVQVCKMVEQEKTETVKVCTYKTVKEKRKVQECTWVEEKVKEKVAVNAPCATTTCCKSVCVRERRGCGLFRRANRDCGGCN